MKTLYNRQNSQIIHLADGQKESAEALHHTQTALNNTIAIVNEHSNELKQNRMGIKTLLSIVTFLEKELSSFTHAVETHFLHESIEDILANKLNLHFIHHYDLPRVLKIIAKRTNVQMDDSSDTLPMIELINRLLVHQRIDYLPGDINARSDQAVIGNLLFVSFFASANKDQQSFSTYQLIPIPFYHGNQRAKVAQLPQVIGISIQTFELIQWTKEESETCKFEVLSSCWGTPPIRRQWEETCLFEILTDTNLTLCRVEYEPEPIFVHRIGQQWAISTRNETKCHRVTQAEQERHVITANNQISIPPIALITVEKSTALSCDHFFLPSVSNGTSEFISIIENRTIKYDESSVIDLYQTLVNNTQWEKIPYIPGNMESIIDHLVTSPHTTMNQLKTWEQQAMKIGLITLSEMVFILIGFSACIIREAKKKAATNTISMPRVWIASRESRKQYWKTWKNTMGHISESPKE